MTKILDETHQEDIQLIGRIVQQDEAALRRLVDKYKSRLMGLAFKTVYSKELAEEVVMDVFVRVWEKAALFNADKGNLRGWLFQMTRNRAIDYLRKSGRRVDDTAVGWTDVHENVIPAAGDDPEKQAQKNDLAQVVQAALSQLSEDQQKVIGLAYYKGLSNSQIANETGIPLGTVKTRIRRGMLKLKDFLSESDLARLT